MLNTDENHWPIMLIKSLTFHTWCFQMPQLRSETMSMIGLNLFQQLSQLARVANDSLDNPMSEDQVSNFTRCLSSGYTRVANDSLDNPMSEDQVSNFTRCYLVGTLEWLTTH